MQLVESIGILECFRSLPIASCKYRLSGRGCLPAPQTFFQWLKYDYQWYYWYDV